MMSFGNVAIKTVFKQLGLPPDGNIKREVWEKHAEHQRDILKKLKPVEAENVYKGLMAICDLLGLDKYAKDGGYAYTAREMEIVVRILADKGMADAVRKLHSAYFRAVDTSGDRVLQKKEWSNYLKLRGTYVNDEQAQKSFDSVDTNKNGAISLPEFVEYAVSFWCNLGEDLGAQDLYGTKDI